MTASDTRSSDRVSSFALAMRAVPSSAIFGMDGHHVWDPSVIEVDGTFHLFASRWPVEAGFEGWRGSEVIRAVAPSLLGPYTFCEVVLRAADHPFARRGVHNPKTVRIGERFLLYHLAIPPWQTGFALATSINGPWTVVDHPVIPTSNPAILARPDGSIYAVGKCKPEPVRPSGWDTAMEAFEAPDLLGPYSRVGEGNRLPDGYQLEDPTLWYAEGRYHVICTDWNAHATGIQKAMVHYSSANGVTYRLESNTPICSHVEPIPMTDCDPLHVARLERPEVHVDATGAVTALLVAAVMPPGEGPSQIVIWPVDRYRPAAVNQP